MFIYLIGLEGDPNSSIILSNYFHNNCIEKENIDTTNSIIKAMGLLGDERFISILNNSREFYTNSPYKGYLINKSFYLITGKNYYKKDNLKVFFDIEESFDDYRRIITESTGRKRTSDEMILLDKLSRPPGWN